MARPVGSSRNALPDLLRRWFGPRAGQPGTAFEVDFRASPDGLWIEPRQTSIIAAIAPRHGVRTYRDLAAAAGEAQGTLEVVEPESVALPVGAGDPELFAVRVTGSSMDGGKAPIHDGDWAVMRFARGAPLDGLLGRVVLVQTAADAFGSKYQIKRLVQRDRQLTLASDNPTGPSFNATSETVPIARLEQAIRPEDLAPSVGTSIAEGDLAAAFGLQELLPKTGRWEGHLFAFVDTRGLLVSPDRLRLPIADRRPVGSGNSADCFPETLRTPAAS